MTERSGMSHSAEANASPAAERKAIIVSSLNLRDNLGTAFPFRCINSQPRLGSRWLNLSDSSWSAGWCHLRCPLRVWQAARHECPFCNCQLSLKGRRTPHSPTHSDNGWEGNIFPFLSRSLGWKTVTQWPGSGGGAVSDGFLAVGVGASYTTVGNYGFPSQAPVSAHVCVTYVSTPIQSRLLCTGNRWDWRW